MKALIALLLMVVGIASPAWAFDGPSRLERAFFLGESAASSDLMRLPFWADVLSRENEQQILSIKSERQKSVETIEVADLGALARVNHMINRVRYVSDLESLGLNDVWQTSDEFMQRGGDCEDFAIAKYFALRNHGLASEAMRIALVVDEFTQERHAVLLVSTAQGVVVLDNLTDAVVPAAEAAHYRPIMAMNENRWQLADAHLRSAPSRAEQIARVNVQRQATVLHEVWRTRQVVIDCSQAP